MHITLRLAQGLASLRDRARYLVVREQLKRAKQREGFRLIHFSVQSNHLHLIAEASDRDRLARGIQGLQIRIARALNSQLQRKGRVFGDRYHAHALKSPREVRHALAYVLLNARKHAHQAGVQLDARLDPCSSAEYFDGWKAHPARHATSESPVARATSWLLNFGWRQHGLIAVSEIPGL